MLMMDGVLMDIEDVNQIADPLLQREKFKEVIEKMLTHKPELIFIANNPNFQDFMYDFLMCFADNDTFFMKGYEIFEYVKSSLTDDKFKEIDLICRRKGLTTRFSFGDKVDAQKRNLDADTPSKKRKREKKVSFSDLVKETYIYVDRERNDYCRNYFRDKLDERERIIGTKTEFDKAEVPWYDPIRSKVCPRKKDTEESKEQEKREVETVSYVNDDVNCNFPLQNAHTDGVAVEKTVVIPNYKLGVCNIWNKIDFVKIADDAAIDVAEILKDDAFFDKFL